MNDSATVKNYILSEGLEIYFGNKWLPVTATLTVEALLLEFPGGTGGSLNNDENSLPHGSSAGSNKSEPGFEGDDPPSLSLLSHDLFLQLHVKL